MVWRLEDPQGNEAAKVKYDVVPYTRGRGLDLGCGPFKAFPHFTGVDNGNHARQFGWQMQPDLSVESCDNLDLIASSSMDFVFSSHLLEHIEDTRKALKEWWRVLKNGGHLCLYLPHRDFYPNIGQPGANPDHKHDFIPKDIVDLMGVMGSWDLLVNENRNAGMEYSFLLVFKKATNGKHSFSHANPRPERSVCVVRYGGIGDILQGAAVCPGLKEQGYHVTMMTSPEGAAILAGNSHIDAYLVQDKDQVPNAELGQFWSVWEKKFDKFVNLCESVEGTLLALPDRMSYNWPLPVRQKFLGGVSYYERVADLADVPHRFAPSFFPSKDEKAWALKQAQAMPGDNIVMISLAGSSIHKAYPYTDDLLNVLMRDTDATVVFVGDERCQLLEEAAIEGMLIKQGVQTGLVLEAIKQDGLNGLEILVQRKFGKQRVICQSGKWALRQTLAFLEQCSAVVGPETGVLNAAAFLPLAKIVLMSHSSPENLCKHWTNTSALLAGAECQPCHRMHYSRDSCPEHKETSASMCMGMLPFEAVAEAVIGRLPKVKAYAVK